MSKQSEMPILRIDLGSPTPVYRQIVDSLRALLVGGAFAPGGRMSLYVRVQLIGIWFFARPLVLDAARVKENCFSLSFIPAPSCQSWWRAATGKFCRFSGGFAPSPRP